METLSGQRNSKMQTFSFFNKKRPGFWLLGIVFFVVLLLAVSLLGAQHFISSPTVKEKIQQTLSARTGIQIGYEKIGIRYFPFPTLALRQLTFSIPGKLNGKANTLRIAPKITELLTGKLNLGKVVLERPNFNLEWAESQPAGHPKATDLSPN